MALSRRVKGYLAASSVFLAVLGLAGVLAALRLERNARADVIAGLRKQFASDVALGDLKFSFFPRVRASGENLVLRFGGRTDLPPLIAVKRFTVAASFAGFLRSPMHIGSVTLEGLEVHIPPKQSGDSGARASGSSFVVDDVIADGAVLEILPGDPGKNPLKFEIRRLRLGSAGSSSMAFHAELMNALPPGLIQSDGHLGAWRAKDPGATAVSGQYTFRNADLGVFKGIKGTLSSDGRYQGELAKIEVRGTADVPNFMLEIAGNPVDLKTTFAATVDGIHGDTDLHPVEATIGNSEFQVTGSIERGAIAHGKEIDLNAKSTRSSLQDLLRLAVRGRKAPITGVVGFDSRIRIPPGPDAVIRKLQLNGQFNASDVKFTDAEVQDKMASLSHRAEGEPRDHDPAVSGLMAGHFILDKGIMSLPRLEFDLPGAKVNLDGTYTLAGGAIDFKGNARLDAKISQMTTGLKSLLLKPVDPLFRHDGAGAVVPIRVSGTRGDPSFRLDIGRAMRGVK